MSFWFQAKAFIKYKWRAKDEHSVHSPFVFRFYTQVLAKGKIFSDFREIEVSRKNLLQDERALPFTEMGAGSHVLSSASRQVNKLAASSLQEQEIAQMLYRLVNEFKPLNIIELGTSLGITSMYLARSYSKSHVYTLEGNAAVQEMAQEQFDKAEIRNITPIIGNFDETLQPLLNSVTQVDLVYFDGNHRYEPTVRYFEACLKKSTEQSVFVFDDIHWSEEMEKAWEYIKHHPSVMISIDIYKLGIVFFRKNQPKQHYILKTGLAENKLPEWF